MVIPNSEWYGRRAVMGGVHSLPFPQKTMKLKRYLVTLALLVASMPASAIYISEKMVNDYLEKKIAEKNQKDVKVLNSHVALLDGYASICASVRSRYLAKDVDFCADMTPAWRQETASLHATRMALVSLDGPGVPPQQIEALKTLLNQIVLPRLEGVELYRTEELIGKRISSVKVVPGQLDISM